MELREYSKLMLQRVASLDEEEKAALRDLGRTPAAAVLMKVLGPELTEQLDVDKDPEKRKGLASR